MSSNTSDEARTGTFRRLGFFRTFVDTTGETLEQVAKAAGISKVQLNNWFRNDNARLDQLQDLAEHYGYTMTVTMTTKRTAGEAPAAILKGRDLKTDGGWVSVKRLAFLSVALREAGVTQVELARRLKITKYSVAAWFKADTIIYSRLFDIAEAAGLNLFVRISPHEPDARPEPEGVVVESVITYRERDVLAHGDARD